MLAKVKKLIDEYGLDDYKKHIIDTDDPYKYVRSYHKHSFIMTISDSKPSKYGLPR